MPSGLVQNTDFSSDLLLNKVMNGQYSATSGKTITLAGRLNANQMDAQATSYAVTAENVRKGSVYADAAANALSEIADIAKRASQYNASMEGEALKTAATGLQAELTALLKTTTDDGKKIFDAAANQPTVDLGQGAGTITLGPNTAGGISSLSSALSLLTGGSKITDGSLDKVQSQLLGEISDQSAKSALLENRYTSLNDLISSYKSASDDQVVNAGGSSTSLLNNLLS